MNRRPDIRIYDDAGSCGDCAHASDFRGYLYSPRAFTVKCAKRNCRVYALSGRCLDYRRGEEVDDGDQ